MGRQWTFGSEVKEVARVTEEVLAAMLTHAKECGADTKHYAMGFRTAVNEVLVNHAKHGNQYKAERFVTVDLHLEPERITIESSDEGPGFSIKDVPDATDPENWDRPCGRGILMIKYYTADKGGSLEFLGNRVLMSFVLETREALQAV